MGISYLIPLNNPLFKNMPFVGSFRHLVMCCICVFVFVYFCMRHWAVWTEPELFCKEPLLWLLMQASPAWGTYSTWAHYSCRSKGPCQKGASKEVRRLSIYLHYHQNGGTLCIKLRNYFFPGLFTFLAIEWLYPSIHPYLWGKHFFCLLWFNENYILAPIFEHVTLAVFFALESYLREGVIAIREQRERWEMCWPHVKWG